jgi:hypothetical protein
MVSGLADVGNLARDPYMNCLIVHAVVGYAGFLYRLPLGRWRPSRRNDRWPRGGVVTQRSAKPFTPVQFRAWPPSLKPERTTQSPNAGELSGILVNKYTTLPKPVASAETIRESAELGVR